MIPIRNIDGEVIAFGGRELNTINPLDAPVTNSESEEDKKSSKIAKYVNSPSSAGK